MLHAVTLGPSKGSMDPDSGVSTLPTMPISGQNHIAHLQTAPAHSDWQVFRKAWVCAIHYEDKIISMLETHTAQAQTEI